MNDENVDIKDSEDTMTQFEKSGKTAMLIAINQEYRGMVAVADTVKDSTAAAIKQLHDLNIKVVMLTGDNERTAQAIANEVGIDTIIAQVLPEEKAAKNQITPNPR